MKASNGKRSSGGINAKRDMTDPWVVLTGDWLSGNSSTSRGGYFTKFSVAAFSTPKKNWTQSDLKFCENEGSKNI